MSEKKRVSYIDIARGLGILAIVLCHGCRDHYISRYLFSFEVPLFFMLAGMTFSDRDDFASFAMKKFRTVMVPFYTAALICIPLYVVLGATVGRMLNIAGEMIRADEIVPNILWGVIYATSKNGFMKWNTPLWFLPCLFALEMIVFIFEKYLNGDKSTFKRTLFCILFTSAGILWQRCFRKVYLPFQLETAFNMVLFMELGIMFREYEKSHELSRTAALAIGIILIIAGITAARFNPQISVRTDGYHNYAVFLVSALASSFGYILLSFGIGSLSGAQYAGSHSLVILLWHKFPLLVLQMLVNRLVRADITDTLAGYIYVISASALTIAGCLLMEEIYLRIKQRWHFLP